MDPQSLQMHCLKHVLMSQQCSKRGCTKVPMSFQVLRGEEVLWCQEHYEFSQFYHDALHTYCTHHNGDRPFRVRVGYTTAYIYKNAFSRDNIHDRSPVRSYKNIVRVFIGDSYGKEKGNTILLEIEPQHYVYIGENIHSFKTENVIEEYYSYLGSNDVPHPVAVGTKYVYFLRDGFYFNKSDFPLEIDWAIAAVSPLGKWVQNGTRYFPHKLS